MSETKTSQDLQAMIDDAEVNSVIVLQQNYTMNLNLKKFVLGWRTCQKSLQLNKEGLVLDGNNKKLCLKIDEPIQEDVAVIEVTDKARYCKIKNLLIEVDYNGASSPRMIYAIRNLAKNARFSNCRIKMICGNQINMTGIRNEANIDTTLESGADETVISNCAVSLYSYAVEYNRPQELCGIYNHLGNSVEISNNYVFVQNRGAGELQHALGLYNSGRYSRLNNNNIKANGNHNVGKQLENCYATGVLNRGDYFMITGNNIVGEWGGQCLGLVNHAKHVKIDGNKILSTHTIKGSSIRQYGTNGLITNNIVTSTSRNPRLIEVFAESNIINANVIDALMNNECYSGCGIALKGSNSQRLKNIIIKSNIIRGTTDIGIWLNECEACMVSDNNIQGVMQRTHFVAVADQSGRNTVGSNVFDKTFVPEVSLAINNLDETKIVSVF